MNDDIIPPYLNRGIPPQPFRSDLRRPSMEASRAQTISLDQLPEGNWATVADVAVPADSAGRTLVLRLLELGFVPGERVLMVREGRTDRDPLAVRLGHTTFGLRRREAAFIHVTPST